MFDSKKFLFALALPVSLATFSGCTVREYPAPQYASYQPDDDSREDIPPSSGPDAVWIHGHWRGERRHSEWIPGHWERRHRDHRWDQGHYEARGGVQVWVGDGRR